MHDNTCMLERNEKIRVSLVLSISFLVTDAITGSRTFTGARVEVTVLLSAYQFQ
jgi:hypothetical protein